MSGALRPLVLAAALLVLVTFGLGVATVAKRPETSIPDRAEIFIPDVTLIEPGRSRLSSRALHVRDGRIHCTEPSLRARSIPREARILEEYAGAYVIPGLIDMHVHYWSEEPDLFGSLLLAHGVTTVRDAGDSEGAIFATRRRIEAGEIPGPRIFACGPILDGADPVWPGSIGLRRREAARRAVRDLARRGADCIKVYHGVTGPVLAAIREAAREVDLPVIGHVPSSVRLEDAGLADVQHLSGVPLLSEDPQAPFGERLEASSGAWRSLPPERIEAVVRSALVNGTAHTPTLVFWERLFRLRGEDPTVARTLPRWHRDLFWDPSRPWNRSSGDERRHLEALRRMKDVVAQLHAGGARLHAGSDALNPFVVPGKSLHAEIDHLADAGLSPADALAAATWVAAESLGRPGLGHLSGGSAADFVLYRRDPTRNTSELGSPLAVVARGRLWTRDELERRMAAYRGWFADPVVEVVTSSLARIATAVGRPERQL